MDNNTEPQAPTSCPLCGGEIRVTCIRCRACDTEIRNSFVMGGLATLSPELQTFVRVFLRNRGNLKGVEAELGVSYPTINRMLEVINRQLTGEAETELSRKEILDAIERGEMNVRDAARILKGGK